MSTETAEIVRLCEALPEDKRIEVVDFARFLLGRLNNPDDLAWEKAIAESAPRPKLEAFLRESAAEGGDVPLDLKRL